MGYGEGKLLLRSFLPRIKNKTKTKTKTKTKNKKTIAKSKKI